MALDAHHDLGDLNRFGDVIHTARLKPPPPWSGVSLSALMKITGMSRVVFFGLQPATGFEPVDARHHHIQQNQIRLDPSCALQCFKTILGHDHTETALLEVIDDNADIGGRVVDD